MLAAKYRLSGEDRFENVEKKGKIVQSDTFGIAFVLRGDKEASCFGVIVSKKISPDAFLRNNIKRTIFEAIRQSWIDVKPGFDVVFLVKPTSVRKPTEKLMAEVRESLKKAGIMK